MIENIFVFFNPEYLKIFISLSVNKVLKKLCRYQKNKWKHFKN